MAKHKVSIIGAGNVGATTTYYLAEKVLADLVMIDIAGRMTQAKAMDFLHAGPLRGYDVSISILGTDDFAQIADSNWGDGVFEVQARKLGGFDGFQIQFQADEDGQQRVWNIGGWGNVRIALQGIFGEPKVPGKVETGRWYNIRIELAGPRIRCYLD